MNLSMNTAQFEFNYWDIYANEIVKRPMVRVVKI